MGDRPIIFSAPMVRALLDGRKTQTRRILKPQPEGFLLEDGRPAQIGLLHVEGDPLPRVTIGRVVTSQEVRYAVGDRLWVREAFMLVGGGDPSIPLHRANWREEAEALHMDNVPTAEPRGWRPSIHMPRWASRLTLIVEAVKVERLQDISEADAQAEGLLPYPHEGPGGMTVTSWHWLHGKPEEETYCTPQYAFRALWNSINGADAWDANPFVVAVSFVVHRANIDALKAEVAA